MSGGAIKKEEKGKKGKIKIAGFGIYILCCPVTKHLSMQMEMVHC